MIRYRAAVAVLAVSTLLLAACTTPPTRWAGPISGKPAASGAPGGPAAWTPCPDISERKLSNVTFECATVKVPQDWAAPVADKTFDLSLVRARAKGQRNRIGSLLVNPGGPGGSGVDLATGLAGVLPTDVLFRFDIVGFDPRGVGRSSPIDCFSDADLDATFGYEPDPVSQADFDGLAALSKKMADSCGTKLGDTLPLFSTEQAARDMEAIRAAVGDEKLTYLGYSYGTLLGAVYANLFPTRIRAMVLDGAVDPNETEIASLEGQAKGFELAFTNFTAWCKATPAECPIAPDARTAVTAAMQTGRTSPVSSGGRKATAGWIFNAVIASMYSEELWRPLATAIANLKSGNAAALFEIVDNHVRRNSSGQYENLFDVLATVNCTDDEASMTVAQSRQLQTEWRTKYPLFGPNSALNLVCAQWPGKRDPFPKGRADGAPPIVVVGTTGDPATPYENAPTLAKLLGVGITITHEGEGHTVYPFNRCVNGLVNAYLIDLKAPPEGQRCTD